HLPHAQGSHRCSPSDAAVLACVSAKGSRAREEPYAQSALYVRSMLAMSSPIEIPQSSCLTDGSRGNIGIRPRTTIAYSPTAAQACQVRGPKPALLIRLLKCRRPGTHHTAASSRRPVSFAVSGPKLERKPCNRPSIQRPCEFLYHARVFGSC